MNDLISLLIYVVVAIVVVWGVQTLLGMLSIPAQAKTLIIVIVVLVILVYMLRVVGLWI